MKPYHNSTLRKAYYKEMHVKTNGRCMICQRDERLVVDHDHKTGSFRGLLCYGCNSGLGMFQDSPEILGDAIVYLQQNSPTYHPKCETKYVEEIALLGDVSFSSDRARARNLAARFGMSEATAQTRVSRARRRLMHASVVEGPMHRP